MRWLTALAMFWLHGPALAAPADTFDNASVVALSRAGLGRDVLIAKIASLPCTYDISTAALVSLRQAQIDQAVIVAMVRRCSADGAPAAAAVVAQPFPRHTPGIYLAVAGQDHDPVMLRPASTVGIKQTGNGSLLFPTKATLTVAQAHAQVGTRDSRPTFHFYFAVSDHRVAEFGTATSEAAQSPNEFSLVRFQTDHDTRQLVVGRVQPLANIDGIDPKIALPFAIQDRGEGYFVVDITTDLSPGEYGFVLVGSGLRNKTYYRVFDFAVLGR